MAPYIHTIIHDEYPFAAQSCALLVAARAALGQAYPTAGSNDPVPRQPGAFWQLA
jgi:hypothetical protein